MNERLRRYLVPVLIIVGLLGFANFYSEQAQAAGNLLDCSDGKIGLDLSTKSSEIPNETGSQFFVAECNISLDAAKTFDSFERVSVGSAEVKTHLPSFNRREAALSVVQELKLEDIEIGQLVQIAPFGNTNATVIGIEGENVKVLWDGKNSSGLMVPMSGDVSIDSLRMVDYPNFETVIRSSEARSFGANAVLKTGLPVRVDYQDKDGNYVAFAPDIKAFFSGGFETTNLVQIEISKDEFQLVDRQISVVLNGFETASQEERDKYVNDAQQMVDGLQSALLRTGRPVFLSKPVVSIYELTDKALNLANIPDVDKRGVRGFSQPEYLNDPQLPSGVYVLNFDGKILAHEIGHHIAMASHPDSCPNDSAQSSVGVFTTFNFEVATLDSGTWDLNSTLDPSAQPCSIIDGGGSQSTSLNNKLLLR